MSTLVVNRNPAIQVQLDDLLAMRLRAKGLRVLGSRRVAINPAGTHASRMRGRGVDYLESRNYQPGDDIRHMDWRVTARTGRPHTKVFQEERERSVLLVLDYNPSLRFGTRVRFKSVQAARAAALVAWATVRGGDRIGVLGFGGGIQSELKPEGGQRGALHCLRALRDWDAMADNASPFTPLSEALVRVRRLARPGSRVILISDGFSADTAVVSSLSLLATHCDIAAIVISDPLEFTAPPAGRYAVRIDTTTHLLDFGRSDLRESWPRVFSERRANLLTQLDKRALPWTWLETRAEPERELVGLLSGVRRLRSTA